MSSVCQSHTGKCAIRSTTSAMVAFTGFVVPASVVVPTSVVIAEAAAAAEAFLSWFNDRPEASKPNESDRSRPSSAVPESNALWVRRTALAKSDLNASVSTSVSTVSCAAGRNAMMPRFPLFTSWSVSCTASCCRTASESRACTARRASASESNSVVCIHAHSNPPANDNVMTTASTIDVTRRPARPSCIPTEISVGTPACRDCTPSISARSSTLGDDLEADRAHT